MILKEDKRLLEPELKALIISKVIDNKKNKINTIINEFTVSSFTRRVDLAIIKNNELHAYEVKSSADTLERLNGQIKEYIKHFDKVTIVADSKHISKILNTTPEYISVWEVKDGKIKIKRRGKKKIITDKSVFIKYFSLSDLYKIIKNENIKIKNNHRDDLESLAITISIGKLREYAINTIKAKYKMTSNYFIKKISCGTIIPSDLLLLRLNDTVKNEVDINILNETIIRDLCQLKEEMDEIKY